MEPQPAYPVIEGGIQTGPENEQGARSLLGSIVGSNAVRAAMRIMAVGSAAGALFASGPFAPELAVADGFQSPQPSPELVATPHYQATPHADTSASSPASQKALKCTNIADYPKGYYLGEACSDDLLIKLGESNPRGFSYGMLIVGGVYKCGWVQDGVVPIDHHRHKSARYCQEASKSLTLNAHAVLKDLNCSPGECKDGTETKETPTCDPVAFANFTTATRSVLNVYPDGKSGFVEAEGAQPHKIYYRATVALSSQFGFAAVVRGEKGWNFMPQRCVPQSVLIQSHTTNNSPSIKLGDSLAPGEPSTSNPSASLTPILS